MAQACESDNGAMLRVSLRRVKPDHLDELRQWFRTVNGPRRDEAIATLADEGCRHEQAYLLSDSEGPLLLYVMEVEGVERTSQAAGTSSHPIDADHLRAMTEAVGDSIEAELVLDLSADG
jgi:hypothetical protein